MFEAIIGSFSLVALSEIGDKTQLLAFSLAARYRKPWPVLAGIFVATILNHGLASSVGQWIATQVHPGVMAIVLAAAFIGFGIWTLRPDVLDETGPDRGFGPFLNTAMLFFLAEMGDKTQMGTVALAAKYHSTAIVTLGTTMGMMFSDGLAVLFGEKFAHRIPMQWIRVGATCLFFGFGLWTLVAGWTLP